MLFFAGLMDRVDINSLLSRSVRQKRPPPAGQTMTGLSVATRESQCDGHILNARGQLRHTPNMVRPSSPKQGMVQAGQTLLPPVVSEDWQQKPAKRLGTARPRDRRWRSGIFGCHVTHHRFGARTDMHFGKHMFQMTANGVDAQLQLVRYQLVGMAL